MDRRSFVTSSAALTALSIARPSWASTETVAATVHTREGVGNLPHVWEECAGSDRAAITLRESWRRDLDRWRNEIGLKRVRFHGIFNDELGVYAPSIQNLGKVAPNFQNIFEVYDGLITRGAAPFVELGFMPKKLASGNATFGFYNANVSPPKSTDAWGQFIGTFVRALIDRYGIAAVRNWPFEVWNEPNLTFFWSGNQQQYFEMYKATAVAIKAIDPQLQVGGPATSDGAWIGDFAAYCSQNNAPVDFFATHCYAGDKKEGVSVNDAIPHTIGKVRQTIDASSFKGRPLWLSEWSSDSPAMIAHVVKHCLPHVRGMSHWTLSGTYEELGVMDVVFKEGDNGWPAMFRGIARPNFNTYKLLHALGTQRLQGDGPVLASRRSDGSVAAVVWNLAEAQQAAGIPGSSAVRTVTGSAKTVKVQFAGQRPGATAKVSFVDQERGSPMPAWRAMGSPQYLTQAQMAKLRVAADIAPPTVMKLDASSSLSLQLPPEGVALIEISRG